MLTHIEVTSNDIEKMLPDADSAYKFAEQVDFDDLIKEAKREVYRLVKNDYINEYDYGGHLTDAEINSALENVKDLPIEQNLKDKIALRVVIKILLQNEHTENLEYIYNQEQSIPLKYYIDKDQDSVVDYTEETTAKQFPTFVRA